MAAPAFDLIWPWMGLGAAGVILLLLPTDALRGDRSAPRWRDLSWLAWVGTCAYLVHQFEEHGVDLRGDAYAFRGALCAMQGYGDAAACPVPTAFITAVNIPVVWVAGPACALLGRWWSSLGPAVALSFFGTPAVNALVHLGPAVAGGGYNPGLLTAAALFLPLSALALMVGWRRADVGPWGSAATVLGGLMLHAALLGSLRAFETGWIGLTTLLAVQVVNPIVLPALVVLAVRASGRSVAG